MNPVLRAILKSKHRGLGSHGNPFLSFSSGGSILGTNLKAYWQFNEASGNLINNAGSVTGNSTLGSAADGTNTSVTYSQTGIIGNSYQYVYASNSNTVIGSSLSQFDFLHKGTPKWSISFWYKFTGAPPFADDNHALFCDMDASHSGIACYIIANTQQLALRFTNGSTSTDLMTGNFFPLDTNFHHVVLTYDESLANNNFLAYLDGSLISTINKSGTRPSDDAGIALKLGQFYGTNYTLAGNLDEFAIWDSRVLTSSEVTTLYGGGSGHALF